MTIEEAIAQLKDFRKDREGFLKNDEPDSEFAKDIEAINVALEHMDLHGTYIGMSAHNELSAKYEKQKSINYELVEENQELVNENKELKRLLRLAVDGITKQKLYADFGMMSRGALCKSCKTRSITNRVCQVYNYEYEHAEEALKLIGDDK